MTVIGRASAAAAGALDRPWPEVGRELGVDYVVQGSVRRDERRAQVSIRVGRVADGQIVSTRPFDAELDDAVGVESRLAESISAEVRVQLADRPGEPPARPVDPDAQAALLEGRHFLRQRTAAGVEQARTAFERAIARAPGFARAYVGLAQTHANFMMGTRLASEARTQARAAVAQALALDDRLAEAHAMLAVLQCADWQFAEAERSLRWAVALDPVDSSARHWLAMFPLVVSGRYEEALVQLRRAKQLDPLSLIINADIGGVYLMTRQFDRAVTQCTESLRLDPHFARAHLYLGMARAALGRHDAAIVALETAHRLDRTPWTRAWLGHAYGTAGRTSDAEALLNSLVSDLDVSEGESPFLVGVVHAGLGKVDEALAWFDRAMVTRSFWVTTLGAFPAFDALRADPRFGGLLDRIRDSAWPGDGAEMRTRPSSAQ
jgi:tetratricopeptide (TPR) repeat protein